jgi:hypothetical protein
MQGKPTRPKREAITRTITIDSGDSVEKILEILQDRGVKPAEATFEVHYADDCGCCSSFSSYGDPCELVYLEAESEELWEARLATYRKRLASWEEWSEENQEQIAQRLAEKTAEKEVKRARLVEHSHKALKRERKTLEKRLKSLEKRLRK